MSTFIQHGQIQINSPTPTGDAGIVLNDNFVNHEDRIAALEGAGPGSSGFSGYSGPAGSAGAAGASGFSGYSGPAGSAGASGFSGYSGKDGCAGVYFITYSSISGGSSFALVATGPDVWADTTTSINIQLQIDKTTIAGASYWRLQVVGVGSFSGQSNIYTAPIATYQCPPLTVSNWTLGMNLLPGSFDAISNNYVGTSGFSGYSGPSGFSGYSGPSGFSGYSGKSGFSGYSGKSGFSGYSGAGLSGFSGYSGKSGFSGYSGAPALNPASYYLQVSFGSGNGAQTNYGLSVSSWGAVNFHTLTSYSLSDPGGNYNATGDYYLVPATGVYRITTKLRITDGEGLPTSFAQGASTSLADGPNVMWFVTTSGAANNRTSTLNVRVSPFTVGDHISMIAFSDDSLDASDGVMVVERVY